MARMTIATQDPSTGKIVRTFAPHTAEQVTAAIATAHAAFGTWRLTGFAERREHMLDTLADALDERTRLVALTHGHPLALSLLLGHVWQRWVEDASRYVPGMKQSTPMTLWAAAAGMAAVGGVGLLLSVAGGV